LSFVGKKGGALEQGFNAGFTGSTRVRRHTGSW